ncbi:MAG: aminotransferase class I/II-fold pyridoxal phosphate-dependent enzyme [Candidatus Latescibacteria bacterium]|nr:aminotransferase class I/II-fold pyridoxal phosphate-dependent enzyme [Candidatus Latescibacterota bacterium]
MVSLSLNGGAPVRQTPFPAWPVFNADDEKALATALHSGQWFLGDRVVEFEQAFAAFQQAQFGVALSSGTTALQVALTAAGVQPGDEVIIPSYTFIATASAVAMTGGVPVFVDVDPSSYNIDPAAVEAAMTDRTRAVIAVHIAGRPADLDALVPLTRKRGIRLIEDAAQAHAAAWNGRRVGAIGDLGTFSFQASKNLNAGEGGFVVSDDRALAELAWSVHNCGRSREGAWYEHEVIGSNYRLSEFQAALLLRQLENLEEQTARRTQNAHQLDALLDDIDGVSPPPADPRVTTHAYHLYIIRYAADQFKGLPRARFIEALQAEGIPCSSGYRPLYKEAAFQRYFRDQPARVPIHCPHTERICDEEAVWLTQNMLLGTTSDTADIATAIAKIRQCADTL